jgi:hypothetical protein
MTLSFYHFLKMLACFHDYMASFFPRKFSHTACILSEILRLKLIILFTQYRYLFKNAKIKWNKKGRQNYTQIWRVSSRFSHAKSSTFDRMLLFALNKQKPIFIFSFSQALMCVQDVQGHRIHVGFLISSNDKNRPGNVMYRNWHICFQSWACRALSVIKLSL